MASHSKKGATQNAFFVFLDETGALMAPFVRRTWSPCGQTLLLRQRTRHYQKVSIIGAVCVPTKPRERIRFYFRLHADANITSDLVLAFLRQLNRQLGAPMHLLWDRFRAHRARRIQDFLLACDHITPHFFPPYAPELNPAEGPWGYIKTNPLANFTPVDLDQLILVTRTAGRRLQRKPNLLRSFLSRSPLSFSRN